MAVRFCQSCRRAYVATGDRCQRCGTTFTGEASASPGWAAAGGSNAPEVASPNPSPMASPPPQMVAIAEQETQLEDDGGVAASGSMDEPMAGEAYIAGPGMAIRGEDELARATTMMEGETERAPLPPVSTSVPEAAAPVLPASPQHTIRGVAVAPPTPAPATSPPLMPGQTPPPPSPSPGFLASMVAGASDPTQPAPDGFAPARDTLRLEHGSGPPPTMQSANYGMATPIGAPLPQRPVVQAQRARAHIPPRWGRIVIGTVLSLLALGVIVAVHVAPPAEDLRVAANVAGGATLVFGMLLVVLGVVFRAEVETQCRSCRRRVFALRTAFGLRCPACARYAKINWVLVASTTVFWIVVASLAVTMLVLLAR